MSIKTKHYNRFLKRFKEGKEGKSEKPFDIKESKVKDNKVEILHTISESCLIAIRYGLSSYHVPDNWLIERFILVPSRINSLKWDHFSCTDFVITCPEYQIKTEAIKELKILKRDMFGQ